MKATLSTVENNFLTGPNKKAIESCPATVLCSYMQEKTKGKVYTDVKYKWKGMDNDTASLTIAKLTASGMWYALLIWVELRAKFTSLD